MSEKNKTQNSKKQSNNEEDYPDEYTYEEIDEYDEG